MLTQSREAEIRCDRGDCLTVIVDHVGCEVVERSVVIGQPTAHYPVPPVANGDDTPHILMFHRTSH